MHQKDATQDQLLDSLSHFISGEYKTALLGTQIYLKRILPNSHFDEEAIAKSQKAVRKKSTN